MRAIQQRAENMELVAELLFATARTGDAVIVQINFEMDLAATKRASQHIHAQRLSVFRRYRDAQPVQRLGHGYLTT
jgi:hypothetical protein